MSNPVRIGIVGLGRAGYGMHLPELKGKEDQFQIVAACDLIPERLEQIKAQFDCAVYTDIDALIADPNVELVDIATRSCDHFDHAMRALLAGKDVLLEKPLCETYEEAKVLYNFVTKPGAPKIYARHNRRFENHLINIKGIIESGKLGEVYEIHITRNGYSRRDDWQTLKEFGGGQLLNWGPHIIDQSLQLLGSPVKMLTSNLKHTVAAGDCEDHLTITFLGENDRTITMQISGGMALPTPEYRVYGTKGALEVVGKKITLRYIDPTQQLPPPVADPGTPGQTFGASGTFAAAEPVRWIEETLDRGAEDLSVIWTHMYEAIRNGATYPISLEEAIAVIEVIDKVKQGTEFQKK